MLRSMTAFARQEIVNDWGSLSCELRSVNHRYLEVFLRLPEEIRPLELKIREALNHGLKRGKIDAQIRFQAAEGKFREVKVNEELAQQIIRACHHLELKLPQAAPLSSMEILRWPGVLEFAQIDQEVLFATTLSLVEKTIKELCIYREKEGQKLQTIITSRLQSMVVIVEKVADKMAEIIQNQREKLLNRLSEIKGELDNNRLEQEMIFLAQKMDVDEELERLRLHIEEMRSTMDRDEPTGRRMDFLMQELNREANTLGSKSAHITTTNASVELKVLIEQMREQIQNIE